MGIQWLVVTIVLLQSLIVQCYPLRSIATKRGATQQIELPNLSIKRNEASLGRFNEGNLISYTSRSIYRSQESQLVNEINTNDRVSGTATNNTSCYFPHREIIALQSLYNSTNGDYWDYSAINGTSYVLNLFENSYLAKFIVNSTELFNQWNIYIENITEVFRYDTPWNFSGNPNPCEDKWRGVYCIYLSEPGVDVGLNSSEIVNSCHVSQVILREMNLTGLLPDNLSTMEYLIALDFANNSIATTIGSNILSISRLQYLNINYNNFYGTIPPALYSMPDIVGLMLSNNFLSGNGYISPNVSSSLRYILLQYNALRGNIIDMFPPNFGIAAAHLRAFSIDLNYFTGTFPVVFCQLQNLEFMSISSNDLNGTIPACISNMTSLRQLDVSGNYFSSSLPKSIMQMNLTMLQISYNNLTGSISDYFNPNWTHMVYFSAFSNLFHGSISSNISYMNNLLAIDLSDNHLTGTLPMELYELDTLIGVTIALTKIHGSISNAIGNLIYMQFLLLSYSEYSGTIPAVLCNTTTLTSLFINGNHFHGTLPSCLGELPYIQKFYASSNLFTGSMPLSYYNSTSLLDLDLSDNTIYLSLPTDLSSWNKMTVLSLTNTFAYGNLIGLCDLQNLAELEVGNDFITGSIPDCLPTSILSLQLYLNYFTGTIPPCIQRMNNLQQLTLFDNYLEGDLTNFYLSSQRILALLLQQNYFIGTIDKLMTQLSYSQYPSIIDVSRNYISGTIPSSIGTFKSLNQIVLDVNCFTGSIPESFCQLNTLNLLSMNGISSACDQSGPSSFHFIVRAYFAQYIRNGIPACLFDLPHLSTLKLSGNGLSGTLPTIPSQSKITYLSLSNNRLTSTIPRSIQYHNFQYLDLSYNQFNGSLNGFSNNVYYNNLSHNPLVAINYTIYLQSNRLSGILPKNFLNFGTISVLVDNLFSCSSSFPPRDPYYRAFSCGSSSLDNSIILYFDTAGGICFVILCFFAIVRLSKYSNRLKESLNQRLQFIRQTTDFLTNCYKQSSELIVVANETSSELGLYVYWLRTLRYVAVLISFLVAGLGFISYPLLKISYHTVTYQYSWTISSAFLTGFIPSLIILIVRSIVIVCCVWLLLYYRHCSKLQSKDEDTEDDRFHRSFMFRKLNKLISSTAAMEQFSTPRFSKKRLRDGIVYFLAMFVNVVIVGFVNVIYALVYITSHNFILINIAGIVLSLFQVSWSYLFVPFALDSMNREARYRPVRFSVYMTVVYFINAIVIPCVVSFISLEACFKDVFIGFQQVSSTNTWSTYEIIKLLFKDFYVVRQNSETVTFEPPFMYSGECSSGILLAYVPVYILIYIFQTIFIPGVYFTLCFVKHESFPALIRPLLPNVIWPSMTTSWRGYPVRTGNKIASIMIDFGVLFTFGILNPFLAFVICCSIASKTITKELMIGRYVLYCKQHAVNATPIKIRQSVSKRIAFAILYDHNADRYFSAVVASIPQSSHQYQSIVESVLYLKESQSSPNPSRKRFGSVAVVTESHFSPQVNRQRLTSAVSPNVSMISDGSFVLSPNDSALSPNIDRKRLASDSTGMSAEMLRANSIATISVSSRQHSDSMVAHQTILESGFVHSQTRLESIVNFDTGIEDTANDISLEFLPYDGLEKACRGMWRSPLKCIWIMTFLSTPFHILFTLDIMGNFSTTGIVMIMLLSVSVPFLLFFTQDYFIAAMFKNKGGVVNGEAAGGIIDSNSHNKDKASDTSMTDGGQMNEEFPKESMNDSFSCNNPILEGTQSMIGIEMQSLSVNS